MAARKRVPEPFDYAQFDAPQILYCRISLAKDWKAELVGSHREKERAIPLTHKRDARTPRRNLTLLPGKSVQLPLDMAEGYFGRFSIPVMDMIAKARTESQQRRLAEEYALTRSQVILRWGDYPRAARAGSGMTYEPLGPARFPDVTATIIPAEEDEDTASDPRYKAVRLRDLYDLGDFVDVEHLCNPGGFMNRAKDEERQAQLDFQQSQESDRVRVLEGTVNTLMALLGGNPELMAKIQAMTAENAPGGKETAAEKKARLAQETANA